MTGALAMFEVTIYQRNKLSMLRFSIVTVTQTTPMRMLKASRQCEYSLLHQLYDRRGHRLWHGGACFSRVLLRVIRPPRHCHGHACLREQEIRVARGQEIWVARVQEMRLLPRSLLEAPLQPLRSAQQRLARSRLDWPLVRPPPLRPPP